MYRVKISSKAIRKNQVKFAKMAQKAINISDAFDNKSGKDFNGRRGRVVGIRYGDIIIKSDDNKAPLLEGVHLRPDQLEKRL